MEKATSLRDAVMGKTARDPTPVFEDWDLSMTLEYDGLFKEILIRANVACGLAPDDPSPIVVSPSVRVSAEAIFPPHFVHFGAREARGSVLPWELRRWALILGGDLDSNYRVQLSPGRRPISVHTLHALMVLPDLYFPGTDTRINPFSPAPQARAIAKRVQRLRQIGQEIVQIAGGEAIHPSNPRVGGMYRNVPTQAKIRMYDIWIMEL